MKTHLPQELLTKLREKAVLLPGPELGQCLSRIDFHSDWRGSKKSTMLEQLDSIIERALRKFTAEQIQSRLDSAVVNFTNKKNSRAEKASAEAVELAQAVKDHPKDCVRWTAKPKDDFSEIVIEPCVVLGVEISSGNVAVRIKYPQFADMAATELALPKALHGSREAAIDRAIAAVEPKATEARKKADDLEKALAHLRVLRESCGDLPE